MDNIGKLLGGSRQELIVGSTKWSAPAGFAAFYCKVRVDATKIATLDEVRVKGAAAVAVTTKTWEDKDLLAGDEILFEYPVTSITLTNAGDSLWVYLVPYL